MGRTGRVWSRARVARRTASAVGAALLLGGCWVAPGGNANRNGHNSVDTVIGIDSAAHLTEAWQAAVPSSSSTPSPVVLGRHVYTTDGAHVIALDVTTGTTVWADPVVQPRVLDLFISGDELVSVQGDDPMGSPQGIRHDPATGEHVGDTPAFQALRGTVAAQIVQPFLPVINTHYLRVEVLAGSTPAWSTPIVSDLQRWPPPIPTVTVERVVVSGEGPVSTDPTSPSTALGLRAYAIEGPQADCGSYDCPEWAIPVDGTSTTAAVVSDDLTTVVIGTDAGLVYAVSEATGSVLWTANVGSAVTADPGIAGDTVLVPTADDGLVALPLAGCGAPTCVPTWVSASAAGVAQQPVSAGGAVFVGHDGGSLAAYAVAGCGSPTCEPVWSTSLGGTFNKPMAIGSGHLFVTVGSVMHAFTPESE